MVQIIQYAKNCHTENIMTNIAKGSIDSLTYIIPFTILGHGPQCCGQYIYIHTRQAYMKSLSSHATHVSLGTWRSCMYYLMMGLVDLIAYNACNLKPRVCVHATLLYLLHFILCNKLLHILEGVGDYNTLLFLQIITASNYRDNPHLIHRRAL